MPAPQDYERIYLDRLRQQELERQISDRANLSEGSTEWTPVDQGIFDRNWNARSLTDILQQRETGNRFGEIALDEGDPLVAQFLEQFGARDWLDEQGNPMTNPDSNNSPAVGYMMGYGDPRYGGTAESGVYDDILQDGSRIIRLPDGRYIREAGNYRGDVVAGAHRDDETAFRNLRQQTAAAAAAIMAGGYGLGEMGLLGEAVPGIDAATGMGLGGSAGAGLGATSPWGMLAPGMENAALLDSWLINNGMSGLAGGALTSALGAPGTFLRQILSGMSGGSNGSGGTLMGGFGSLPPRVGDHKQDTDPYGLEASGLGPWRGLTADEPKDKVVEAMMKKPKVNPWDFVR